MKNTSAEAADRIRVGISACLIGEPVRFDGGHKRDAFLADVFGKYVDWVPVCPEVEAGLGMPRETMRLINVHGETRFVSSKSGVDHTDTMTAWPERRLEQLAALNLCGFVFNRSSPSCGLERVRVYRNQGLLHRKGVGVFSAALARRLSTLPVEEEGRLHDPRLRENFASCVFAYKRWLDLSTQGINRAAVMQFHARHKFLLMAHSQSGLRMLGRLAASGEEYFGSFCEIMRRTPTRRNHTNVLHHLAGYFSQQLGSADRAELTELIDSYRRGLLPLIAPLTLIRHYARKYSVRYLLEQVYLDSHPEELMLLNQL